VPIVSKSGSLKLLKRLGPAQACNRIAFKKTFGYFNGIYVVLRVTLAEIFHITVIHFQYIIPQFDYRTSYNKSQQDALFLDFILRNSASRWFLL
jgi:hypothetical protein